MSEDGRRKTPRHPATIRPVDRTDAVALIELEQAVLCDGRGQVRGPHEVPELGRMQARLERFIDGDCSAQMGGLWVAELQGRVVGEVSLQRLAPSYCQHVASLALQVHPEAQGQGLGRALLQTVIARAAELGVRRLELRVHADNERAIRLYRSEGFSVEFTRPCFVRLPDGTLVDDHCMVRLLPEPALEKAVGLVVRSGQLLVLQHPHSGWKLPKGTLEPTEPPGAAAVRGVLEETGLRTRIVRSLGWWTQSGADGAIQRWHGFILEPEDAAAPPARWEHTVTGTGEEQGLVFQLEWHRFQPELLLAFHARFHETLHRGLA